MYNNLLMEVENEIAVVTINRPKALNALNTETITELNECLKAIEERDDIKVVILTGSGQKSFVAGADISEMVNQNPVEGAKFGLIAKEAFGRLENMRQVTIAAVNGFALGGGCVISMSCDFRVASDNAKFAQPETGLGIIPGFGGTQRLPRLTNKGIAKEMIFTCDMISAQRAYEIGLVNHVVSQEELIDFCKKIAAKIIDKGSYAVTIAKRCINMGLDMDLNNGLSLEAHMFGLTFATADKKEGMTAFLEKRGRTLSDF